MQNLLRGIVKNASGTLDGIHEEAPFGLLANQRSEELQDQKNTEMVEKGDRKIENEDLNKDLAKGKTDERKPRKEFGLESDSEESRASVYKLVPEEKPQALARTQALLEPVLSSREDMLTLFGGPDSIKTRAPSYWKDEVSKGSTEHARLIKVGIDIPAVWRLEDALQEITADLYITFTWEVEAKRDDIWNSVSREFTAPVWKLRLGNGKFISNLKQSLYVDEFLSCGNEQNGKTTIIQRMTITGHFSQKFDLHRFPFDVQTVGFQIRYWLVPYSYPKGEKEGRLIFFEDIDWKCRVKEGALKPTDEWIVSRSSGREYDNLKVISGLTDTKKDPKHGRRWPELQFSFIIERDAEFMKWNVALPITMIVVFGLIGNLTAICSDFDRPSFTAALLFTIFSIKQNAQYALSKVGYRTTLDSYILLSQAMVIIQGLVGVAVSHVITDEMSSEEEVDLIKISMIFGVLGGLFWMVMTYRFWTGQTLFCYSANDYKVPDYEETVYSKRHTCEQEIKEQLQM